MADFWVYENRRVHGPQSRVHLGTCPFCKLDPTGLDGTGAAAGAPGTTWHGPYPTLMAANQQSLALPGTTHHCKVCHPTS